MESAEQIRRATINDIGGILELIIARWSSRAFWSGVRANSWR